MSISYQQWQQHIDAWQQTKLTQAQYCRSHQIDQSQFSYWKRKGLEASNTNTSLLNSLSLKWKCSIPPQAFQ
ncbi:MULTISPECIES: hypothetical protein [unclassified Vibrio]|uniref:IS66 family insertion sequence element accessory protein TnpA n=1 Tax=unclassified Vibrio TaxID=2614977 RepID=UPI001F0E3B67|nr:MULTISPECIES: hypothetical protein [unclassified Vibrio]